MSRAPIRLALIFCCGVLVGGVGASMIRDGTSGAEARSEATASQDEPYELDIPLGLEGLPPRIPPDNPLTVRKVALGHQLYFDPRLSADRTLACASCHNPRFGFTDGQAVSTGIRGQKGGRSAPTTVNRVFSTTQFWDGRSGSLEDQAKGPIANPIEMGMPHDLAVERVRNIPGYRQQMRAVFGTEAISIDHIAKAIAAYERTLMSGNTPVDRFRAGSRAALGPAEQRGMALFEGKARCAQCHVGPNFTDEQFHNIGIAAASASLDGGRFEVTKRETDRGAFKTPTVRDIALSAPYFHDGSASTLRDVMLYYNRGGTPHPQLSGLVKPLGLTPREIDDVVAFLHALTGEVPLGALAPPLPAEPRGAP